MRVRLRQGLEWLEGRVAEWLSHRAVYAHEWSTSPLEALNSQIHRCARKDVAFACSYIARADIALLVYDLGYAVRRARPRRPRALCGAGGRRGAPRAAACLTQDGCTLAPAAWPLFFPGGLLALGLHAASRHEAWRDT